MMRIRNSKEVFGWPAIGFHWASAGLIMLLFFIGLEIDGLDYYDPSYKAISSWHKGLGFLFFMLLLLRLCWRLANPQPAWEPTIPVWQKKMASIFQYVAYVLMATTPLSGYFIASAEGHDVAVFDWFVIPAVIDFEDPADIGGRLHAIFAWALVLLAGIHAAAALKHHFIDKDNTMLKILGLIQKEKRDD